jgi:hypothetical protein
LSCARSDKNFLPLAAITALSRPFTGPEGGPVIHAVAYKERAAATAVFERLEEKKRVYSFICVLSAQNGVRETHSWEFVSAHTFFCPFQDKQMTAAKLLKGVCLISTQNKTYAQKLTLIVVFSE